VQVDKSSNLDLVLNEGFESLVFLRKVFQGCLNTGNDRGKKAAIGKPDPNENIEENLCEAEMGIFKAFQRSEIGR